jgi:hypothetical protein
MNNLRVRGMINVRAYIGMFIDGTDHFVSRDFEDLLVLTWRGSKAREWFMWQLHCGTLRKNGASMTTMVSTRRISPGNKH